MELQLEEEIVTKEEAVDYILEIRSHQNE